MNTTSSTTPQLRTDTNIPGDTIIATYDSYLAAQSAVDLLSDRKFDVSAVHILGRGLHSVEDVQGRMTKGKATLYGAASGAWFGLLIGLLMGVFVPLALWSALLGGLVIGAIWGAIFGFFGHLATGGRRDFVSAKTIVASEYDVAVDAALADEARRLLQQGR